MLLGVHTFHGGRHVDEIGDFHAILVNTGYHLVAVVCSVLCLDTCLTVKSRATNAGEHTPQAGDLPFWE